MKAEQRLRAATADTAAALHHARQECAQAKAEADKAGKVSAAVRAVQGELRTELQRALVSSKVNPSGRASSKQSTLPREVQQLREDLEDELRAALESWVLRTTDDAAELDDAQAQKLAAAVQLLEIEVSDFVAAVRKAFVGRLRAPQGGMVELRRAWQLAESGISALTRALTIDERDQLERIGTQLNSVADSISELGASEWHQWLQRVFRSWRKAGE